MGCLLSKICKKKEEEEEEEEAENYKPLQPPRKTTPAKNNMEEIVKALYDFDGTNDGDLVFKAGERMRVISKTDPDWWEAEKVRDGTKGFIPHNFVVVDSDEVEAQEWWFDVDRREATYRLKLLENDVGAFMIRRTEDNSLFALSVLWGRDDGSKNIKHFRIKQGEDGSLYITSLMRFGNISSLVEHYQHNNLPNHQLRLGQPCTREMKNIPFKHLELERSAIKLGEQLGDGMFGTVQKGTLNKKHSVAVKMLKEDAAMQSEQFVKEAEMIHKLRHPRVVQLIGVCMEKEPYWIVMEFMSKGSLLRFLRNNSSQIEVGQLLDISCQIADGMSYLESQSPPYLHRDLRAANCLVNENNIAKVSDFGLAKILDEGVYEGGVDCKFPVKWTAPEGLSEKTFTVKSDVWSYGILLYEIFGLGKAPYPGWDNAKIKDEVQRGYILSPPTHPRVSCPEEIKRIMLQCLSWEPSQRPSFHGIKSTIGAIGGSDSYQSFDDK